MPTVTFVNGWALWLATGAVLPLIIHLFSRRRPAVVRFPAVRFIRSGRRRSARRTRLKHLLLLLVRMAVIALFALMIARPAIGKAPAAGEGATTGTPAAVLVLDDSLSMSYRLGEASRFDAAQSRALEVLAALPPQAAVAVITTSRPTGKLTADAGQAAARARALKATTRADPCWGALHEAADLLHVAAAGRRDVFLFTDMTPGAWLGHERQTADLGPDTNLFIVDCAEDAAANAAVTEVQDESPLILRGATLVLRTRLAASGEPLARTVQFDFDGVPVDRREVALSPGQDVEAEFRVPLREPGHHWGRVAFLEPDGLPADDARTFTVDVPPDVAVLCVEDDVKQERESPSFFFRLALDPWQQAGRGEFRVERATPEQLGELTLRTFDAVALIEAGRLTADGWRRLGTYVAGGGGLLVFCGPRTEAAYRTDESAAVLGTRVTEIAAAPDDTPFGLRLVRTGHPFLDALVQSGAGLAQVRFRACRRLEPSATAEELLAFGPGLPALVLDERGGKVAVFAATADDSWGLFARTPVFVPFCRELVLYLAGRQGGGVKSYGVGARVPITYTPSRWPAVVHVTPPGSTAPELLLPGTTPGRETYWNTDAPGYYAVEIQQGDQTRRDGFAVNPAPTESRLEKLRFEDLRDSIRAGAVQMITDGALGPGSAELHAGGGELTPWVIVLVLVLLGAESVMANRFYGPAAQTAEPPEAAPRPPAGA